jgi:hypothetical protein
VFDFIPETVCGFKAIGDIGIFIDPHFRKTTDENGKEGRCWQDVLRGGVRLIDKFYKLSKLDQNPDNWRISATTHPYNYESKNIFEYKETKRSEYDRQLRKYYVSQYSKFIKGFSVAEGE